MLRGHKSPRAADLQLKAYEASDKGKAPPHPFKVDGMRFFFDGGVLFLCDGAKARRPPAMRQHGGMALLKRPAPGAQWIERSCRKDVLEGSNPSGGFLGLTRHSTFDGGIG